MKTPVKHFFVLIFFCYFNIVNAGESVSWTDLPNHDLFQILYKYSPELDSLNKMIKKYHKVEKNKWCTLAQRFNMLKLIEKKAKEISVQQNEKYLRGTTLKMAEIAHNKANYLLELERLKNGGYRKLKEMILDKTIISPNYTPLLLTNLKKYNYKQELIWGEFFVEATDPCHRKYLNSYYALWKQQQKDGTMPDFFLWLEDKDVSVIFPSTKIFSEQELKKYKVSIKDGKFYSGKGNLISTTEYMSEDIPFRGPVYLREPLFIIDSKENVYICYSGNRVEHPSLSHYKPLIGSGEIMLRNGVVKKISFISGHYLPDALVAKQVIVFFENRGVKFSPQIEVDYFKKLDYTRTTMGEFKKLYMKKHFENNPND